MLGSFLVLLALWVGLLLWVKKRRLNYQKQLCEKIKAGFWKRLDGKFPPEFFTMIAVNNEIDLTLTISARKRIYVATTAIINLFEKPPITVRSSGKPDRYDADKAHLAGRDMALFFIGTFAE
jgi:hypothetical protein